MTKEEIIDNIPAGVHHPDFRKLLLAAMEEYASQHTASKSAGVWVRAEFKNWCNESKKGSVFTEQSIMDFFEYLDETHIPEKGSEEVLFDAHIGSNAEGTHIRNYGSLVCSQCRGVGINFKITQGEFDRLKQIINTKHQQPEQSQQTPVVLSDEEIRSMACGAWIRDAKIMEGKTGFEIYESGYKAALQTRESPMQLGEVERLFELAESRRKTIDKQIIELENQDSEIERLKNLIGKAFSTLPTNPFISEQEAWQQFCTENNLK